MANSNGVALQKAHFINVDQKTTDTTFHVQFNPKELKLDDRANYTPDQGEQSGDRKDFNGSDGAKLSMELVFDTTIPKGGASMDDDPVNVNEQYVRPLRSFLALSKPEAEDSDSKSKDAESRPNRVQFVWGPFDFTGVIESINTTFLMFSAKGVPLRARVTVSMTTDRTDDELKSGSQSSLLPPMLKRIAPSPGSSLGAMASKYGVSEQDMALANGIEDPLGLDDFSLDSLTIPDTSAMAENLRQKFRDLAPKSVMGITEGDVLAAIDTVREAISDVEDTVDKVNAKADEVRKEIEETRQVAQKVVDDINAPIKRVNQKLGEVQDAADSLARKLPGSPDAPTVPTLGEVNDIPDFEPPF